MNVSVTGATGFVGRYIVNHLLGEGHHCRCWYRPESDRGGFDGVEDRIEWIPGSLNETAAADAITKGTEAIVHAALQHQPGSFRGAEGDVLGFVETNVLGTLRLIEAARRANVGRFVFISTCAVHEIILDDRPLDEAHPLWATHHYGAHKAAIEKFVHSYGLGQNYDICALRPTGVYGLARPANKSRWYGIVKAVKESRSIESARGGKEVHASDVAKAAGILLTADGIAGQAYNCYDMYVAEEEVARIAKQITGSDSTISSLNKGPRNQIRSDKLKALGMTFGGRPLLEQTVREIIEVA